MRCKLRETMRGYQKEFRKAKTTSREKDRTVQEEGKTYDDGRRISLRDMTTSQDGKKIAHGREEIPLKEAGLQTCLEAKDSFPVSRRIS